MEQQHRRRKRRSGLLVGAGLISFVMIASACGSSNKSSTNTTTGGATTTAGSATTAGGGAETSTTGASTSAPAAQPVYGGTLRVGVEAETNGWVPAIMQCDEACQIRAKTVFETLTAIDADGKVQGYLAESFDHNADYTSWTFKLRDDVVFHDGTKMDAAGVTDVLKRNFVTGFVGQAVANVKGAGPGMPIDGVAVKATGPDTIQIDMIKPWVDFPAYMASQIGMIASDAWYKKVFANPAAPDAVVGAQPVGSGPFVFDSWKPGDTFTVKKNPNYWRKDANGNPMPYLDGIQFKVIPDSLTKANALKSGQLDMISDDNGHNLKDFANNKDFVQLVQDKQVETAYTLENVGEAGSPLQDQRVRCGIAAATDVNTLNKVINEDAFTVANGPFSPGQPGNLANPGNQTYDPAKAKELISEYTKEKGKPPTIIYSTTNDSTNLKIAELIQQWWKDAGVNVQVQQVEQSKLILNALLGDPGFNAFAWRNHGGQLLDEQYVWWNSSTAAPPGQPALNFGRMKDPVIDQLLDANRAEPDPAKQQQYAEQVNQEFAKQCWMIPGWWVTWHTDTTPAVQGLRDSTFPDGKTLLKPGNGFAGQEWFYQAYLKK